MKSLVCIYIYIYFACLSVRLYPINAETAEPVGPKFCMATHIFILYIYISLGRDVREISANIHKYKESVALLTRQVQLLVFIY